MPKAGLTEQTIDYIERFVESEFGEIRHEHGGEFIAFIESKKYMFGEDYLELIHKLKDEDVDLGSVEIANIPKQR